jgi:hypothetical protein
MLMIISADIQNKNKLEILKLVRRIVLMNLRGLSKMNTKNCVLFAILDKE